MFKKVVRMLALTIPLVFVFTVLISLLLPTEYSLAGTTGKISGTVKDKVNGEPLPGANVVIEGTNWGAATSIDGAFFILNVPPGVYSVKASMIGYKTQVLSNVRVFVDRTTTVTFALEQTVLDVGEVVVTAEREKVRTDVSFTQTAITQEAIAAVPSSPDIKEAISFAPGIYRNDKGQIEIRGGRMDEVGVYVDDISMQAQRSGMPVLSLPQEAIQEVQIIRGGFSAEYGQAQSGIINIVTRDVYSKYSGSIDVRMAPSQQKHFGPNYFSTDNFWHVGRFLSRDSVFSELPWLEGSTKKVLVFQGWDSWFANTPDSQRIDPYNNLPYGSNVEEALAIWKWRHRPQDYGHLPDLNFAATFGGPVPFVGEKLGFFASAQYNRSVYPFKFYRPDFTELTANVKLKYHMTPNMTLRYQGLVSRQEGASMRSGAVNLADPRHWISSALVMGQMFGSGNNSTTGMYIGESLTKLNRIFRSSNTLKLTHTLSPASLYEVQLTHTLTKQRMDRDIDFRDLTHIVKVIDGDSLDIAPLGMYSYVEGNFASPVDRQGAHRLGGGASNRDFDFSWDETITFKLDYTNQINTTHQLKAGLWGFRNDMHLDFGGMNNSQTRDGRPDPANTVKRVWTNRKIPYYEFAAYALDKIEFEGLVLNFGLRLDGLRHNERIFPIFHKYYNSGVVGDSLYLMPDSVAPRGKTRIYLSPRIGISHPLSENSKLFFNYGYFYQRATIEDLFRDAYIPGGSDGLSRLSNAALEFRKTIQYELGYEQMVRDWFRITLSGYYRDGSNEVRSMDLTSRTGQTYGYSVNTGFSDISGFEVELQLPQRYYFSGWMNLDYRVKTSGSYGFLRFYEEPDQEPVPADTRPIVSKARPFFRANLIFHTPSLNNKILNAVLSDVLASFLFQWRAGEWITYHHPTYWPGDDQQDPANLQWESWKRLDLRLSKQFRSSGLRFKLYMDVRNLLNTKYFYSGLIPFLSASKDYTLFNKDEYMEEIGRLGLKPGNVTHPDIQRMLEHGPYWIFYGEPRHFSFGIEFSF